MSSKIKLSIGEDNKSSNIVNSEQKQSSKGDLLEIYLHAKYLGNFLKHIDPIPSKWKPESLKFTQNKNYLELIIKMRFIYLLQDNKSFLFNDQLVAIIYQTTWKIKFVVPYTCIYTSKGVRFAHLLNIENSFEHFESWANRWNCSICIGYGTRYCNSNSKSRG